MIYDDWSNAAQWIDASIMFFLFRLFLQTFAYVWIPPYYLAKFLQLWTNALWGQRDCQEGRRETS